jgi:hypothetical protein
MTLLQSASQQADSLAIVLRLMQQHMTADTVAAHALAGQTKYDSTVLITLISTLGTIFTGLIAALATFFNRKITAIGEATAAQTGQLNEITVKVNGQLDRAFSQINDLQMKLSEVRTHGTDAAIRELAEVHNKLDATLAELAALKTAVVPPGIR